jgi:hypothetical protein
VRSLDSAEDNVVFEKSESLPIEIVKMCVVIVMILWDSVTSRNFRLHHRFVEQVFMKFSFKFLKGFSSLNLPLKSWCTLWFGNYGVCTVDPPINRLVGGVRCPVMPIVRYFQIVCVCVCV